MHEGLCAASFGARNLGFGLFVYLGIPWIKKGLVACLFLGGEIVIITTLTVLWSGCWLPVRRFYFGILSISAICVPVGIHCVFMLTELLSFSIGGLMAFQDVCVFQTKALWMQHLVTSPTLFQGHFLSLLLGGSTKPGYSHGELNLKKTKIVGRILWLHPENKSNKVTSLLFRALLLSSYCLIGHYWWLRWKTHGGCWFSHVYFT